MDFCVDSRFGASLGSLDLTRLGAVRAGGCGYLISTPHRCIGCVRQTELRATALAVAALFKMLSPQPSRHFPIKETLAILADQFAGASVVLARACRSGSRLRDCR